MGSNQCWAGIQLSFKTEPGVGRKYFGLFFRVYNVNRDCLCLSKCRQSTSILSFIIHLSGI